MFSNICIERFDKKEEIQLFGPGWYEEVFKGEN